jgi:hypothetical protein
VDWGLGIGGLGIGELEDPQLDRELEDPVCNAWYCSLVPSTARHRISVPLNSTFL